MAKVDKSSLDKTLSKLATVFDDLPEAALKEFISNTPVRSGNARRNTKLKDKTITADYAYSQKLEGGSSKQAPDGMLKPTEDWIYDEVERRLKGL